MRWFAFSSIDFRSTNCWVISVLLLSLVSISIVCVATSCLVMVSVSFVSLSSLHVEFSVSTISSTVSISKRRTRLVVPICLQSVGAFLLRGEVRVLGNSDGTAFDCRYLLPMSVLTKSYSLKCPEQTSVHSCIWKSTPSSLLIVWIHFFRSLPGRHLEEKGKRVLGARETRGLGSARREGRKHLPGNHCFHHPAY